MSNFCDWKTWPNPSDGPQQSAKKTAATVCGVMMVMCLVFRVSCFQDSSGPVPLASWKAIAVLPSLSTVLRLHLPLLLPSPQMTGLTVAGEAWMGYGPEDEEQMFSIKGDVRHATRQKHVFFDIFKEVISSYCSLQRVGHFALEEVHSDSLTWKWKTPCL